MTGDRLASTGTIDLSGVSTNGIKLVLNSVGSSINYGTGLTYTFATGTIANFNSTQFAISATGFAISNFSISAGSDLTITFDASQVPEPTTVLLICAGAAGLVRTVRRRLKGETEQPIVV